MNAPLFKVTEITPREIKLQPVSGNGKSLTIDALRDSRRYGWILNYSDPESDFYKVGNKRWTKVKKTRVAVQDIWGDESKTIESPAQQTHECVAPTKIDVKVTLLDDLAQNGNLFNPIKTGIGCFDEWLSSDGGFQRGTSVMVTGEPGVGKTSVLVEMGVKAQEEGAKVLFISAEMGRMDMQRYLKRFPNWGQLPILFLGEYALNDQATQAIEDTLAQGWDMVIIDSYTEVADTVAEENRMSSKRVEKWFLDTQRRHAEMAENAAGVNTTFVTILQLTKGGKFVGSNKLKHMTTAMAHMGFDKSSGGRYMEFSKNRVGLVQEKLYYELGNGVTFDSVEWNTTKAVLATSAAEAELSDEENNLFGELLGAGLFEPQEDGDLIEEVEFAEVD